MNKTVDKINKLRDQISDEFVKFSKVMEDQGQFNDWLFDRKVVKTGQVDKFVRNDETGELEKVVKEKVAFAPTSNGTDKIDWLVDMVHITHLYNARNLLNTAVQTIINKTVSDDVYFENGKKIAFEYSDLKNMCDSYMTLPSELQDMETLLSFFNDDMVSDSIGENGYEIAMRLVKDFSEEFTEYDDIAKLGKYIESRLYRMEDKIRRIGDAKLDKDFEKYANLLIEKKMPENKDRALKLFCDNTEIRLKHSGSKSRHSITAKYNRELDRYIRLLAPFGEKIKYVEDEQPLVGLYEDCKKTYEILNDKRYITASRRHDEQLKFINKCSANPNIDPNMLYKQMQENIERITKNDRTM